MTEKQLINHLKQGISIPGAGFLIIDPRITELPILTIGRDYDRTKKGYKSPYSHNKHWSKLTIEKYKNGDYYSCIYFNAKAKPIEDQIYKGLVYTGLIITGQLNP